MKKYISIVLPTVAAITMSLDPASASLLGTPINLKIAIELRVAEAPAPACQFYTDDVLIGPVLLKGCDRLQFN